MALLLSCSGDEPGAPAGAADLVLRNAAVYTVDSVRSWARSVAVRDGRIVHVGGDSLPAGLIGPATEVVDLRGGMVLPGFQDGHVHLLLGGVELGECTLFTLPTAAAVLDSIGTCAAARPEGWLRGVGWELTAFPEANPTKAMLDRIAPNRPALLEAADGHSAWANSRALELAGITRETPDPPEGRIERDAKGEPSGTLRESAIELVSRMLPERTDEELARGLDRALRLAAERGITAVTEASASERDLRTYAAADRARRLSVRVIAAVDAAPDSSGVAGVIRRLDSWRKRYATPRVRPSAAKLYQDGVIESGTAALLAPYLDRQGDAGAPIYPQPVLDSLVAALDRAEWQVHVHAIGDRAIRMTLDAFEQARSVNGRRDARHTITHLQLIDPADQPRFKALGVVANFEPFWANGDEYLTRLAEPALGPARARWLYPIGSLVRQGAVVSGGSDWSVSSLAPLDGIQVAVTRRPPGSGEPPWRPEETVELSRAIAMYTIDAAYQHHLEKETGSIEVGKLADLVVLERNLFEVPAGDVHAVRVLRTLVEGETTFRR